MGKRFYFSPAAHMVAMGGMRMKNQTSARAALRRICFVLLLMACALRAVQELPPRAAAQEETAPVVQEETAARAAFPTLLFCPPAQQSPQTVEAAEVSVRNPTGAELDLQALLAAPLHFDASADGPLILIVHTHATEAYTPEEGAEYESWGAYHTLDVSQSVVQVGQALADRLNANGIETLHDTTLHDALGYDDAYERAAGVISAYLEAYPGIQMVIDVHRDAAEDAAGNQVALLTQIDGAPAAQLLFVVGTDLGGLEHPNWRGNLALALQLQSYCEGVTPGVFRTLCLRRQRYNGHLTPNSLLLEVGAAGNTLPQAIRSVEFFADRLAELLGA